MENRPIPISTTPEANALEIGRRLTRLDWHVRTTVVCGSSQHAEKAAETLRELDVLAVAMHPDGGGGRFRRSIRSMLDDWGGWMDTEWFAETWNELHRDRELEETPSDDELFDELLRLAPDFGDRIESSFDSSFRTVRLKQILSLGRTVEEGCLPTRALRRGLLGRFQNGRPRFAAYGVDAAVGLVDEYWMQELQHIWQITKVRGWPPEPPVGAFTDSEAAALYVSEFAAAARKTFGVSLFVGTARQKAIWEALRGRALTKTALGNETCEGDARRLHRSGGLPELMEKGWILNKPTIGYYRPDFPPPQLVLERGCPN